VFNPTRELLLNSTLWFCVGILVLLVWQYVKLRGRPDSASQAKEKVVRLLSARPVIFFLCLCAVLRAGFVLYISYVAPLDVMQDIVSAQLLQRGESAYPPQMAPLIVRSLKSEPPRFSLGALFPRLKQKEQWETHGFLPLQAHPPHLILLTIPFVVLLGVHGAALAINLVSLSGLMLIVILIYRSGAFQLSGRTAWLIGIVSLSWEPVLSLLRQGQSGLLVGSLIVLGWYLLRRGHITAAGIPISIAVSLKLYPGVLLVYLLFRYRRAFASAMATLAVLLLAAIPLGGLRLFTEYSGIAGKVTAMYGGHPLNLSLLGILRKNGLQVSVPAFAAIVVGVIGGAVLLLVLQRGAPGKRLLDLEFSLFAALTLLVSPITWDHYIVILILPLVVIGNSVLNEKANWANMIGLAMLALVIAIPAPSLVFPFGTQQLARLVNVRTASILTLALAALSAWIARLQYEAATKGSRAHRPELANVVSSVGRS
jgi:hypothetical protein